MKKHLLFLVIAIFAACACGCVTSERARQILLLKGLADSQSRMGEYVAAQERGFGLLSRDIAAGKLSPGILKQRVIEKYFEPAYCQEVDMTGISEVCVYRRPTGFFSSDLAYLYFDHLGRLVRWEYQPR